MLLALWGIDWFSNRCIRVHKAQLKVVVSRKYPRSASCPLYFWHKHFGNLLKVFFNYREGDRRHTASGNGISRMPSARSSTGLGTDGHTSERQKIVRLHLGIQGVETIAGLAHQSASRAVSAMQQTPLVSEEVAYLSHGIGVAILGHLLMPVIT